MKAEIWVIPPERKVLLTELPGPPASILGYISEEARRAHKARGGLPTVSEIGFHKELFLGLFETPEMGWGKAGELARAKAVELAYEVKYNAGLSCPPTDDELSDEDEYEELFNHDEENELDEDDLDDEDEAE